MCDCGGICNYLSTIFEFGGNENVSIEKKGTFRQRSSNSSKRSGEERYSSICMTNDSSIRSVSLRKKGVSNWETACPQRLLPYKRNSGHGSWMSSMSLSNICFKKALLEIRSDC